MVRCAECRYQVSPAMTWRSEVFPGWVQCRLEADSVVGRARYLSPEFARVCERFEGEFDLA